MQIIVSFKKKGRTKKKEEEKVEGTLGNIDGRKCAMDQGWVLDTVWLKRTVHVTMIQNKIKTNISK